MCETIPGQKALELAVADDHSALDDVSNVIPCFTEPDYVLNIETLKTVANLASLGLV